MSDLISDADVLVNQVKTLNDVIDRYEVGIADLWREWDMDGSNWTRRVGNAAFRLAEMSGAKDPSTEALPAPGYEESLQTVLHFANELFRVVSRMPPLPRDLSHAIEALEDSIIDYNTKRGPTNEK